jgi:hypothetical protein
MHLGWGEHAFCMRAGDRFPPGIALFHVITFIMTGVSATLDAEERPPALEGEFTIDWVASCGSYPLDGHAVPYTRRCSRAPPSTLPLGCGSW